MNIAKLKKLVWQDVIKSWPFSAMCLGLSALIILSVCFASFNLVFIKTESGTMTMLTQETEPAKILDKAGVKLSAEHTYDVNSTGFYDEISVRLDSQNIFTLSNDSVSAADVDQLADPGQTVRYSASIPTSVIISEPSSASTLSSTPSSNGLSSSSSSAVSVINSSSSKVSSSPSSSASSEKPELSDDALLETLKVSKGKLSPSFKQSTYKYTVKVDNSVKSIKVTASASHSKATVDISGAGSLDVGENTVKVVVTAQDGKTTKTYRIIVTREKPESSEPEDDDHEDDDNSSDDRLTNYDFKPVSELKAPKIYVDKKGQPLDYIKMYSGKCTAYYNPNGNLTASGRVFKPGHIAVNPKKIPYGTKMYVVSPSGSLVYGYSIAADTGGFVSNGSGTLVDLAFWTRKECYDFGRRTMNVYILEYK